MGVKRGSVCEVGKRGPSSLHSDWVGLELMFCDSFPHCQRTLQPHSMGAAAFSLSPENTFLWSHRHTPLLTSLPNFSGYHVTPQPACLSVIPQ